MCSNVSRWVGVIVSFSIFSLLLAACNPGPDPREILNQAHDAMREVQSYRFSGEIVQGSKDGELKALQSGEWANLDQWYMKMEVESAGEFARQVSETIVIEQRLFTRELDSNGGAWREFTPLPGGSTTFNPRPESHLAVPDLENVRLLDNIVVNGTTTFQITGERKEIRTLPERFPERPEGDDVEFVTKHTWLISNEDYRLLRYIVEQDTGLGRATFRTTTDFYDYNQPVTIEMPEVAEDSLNLASLLFE